MPLTRQGVKVFPVSTHLLSKLRGPLAVEGGVTGADRSLKNGVKLPGETDAPLFEIGPQPPEGKAIDVLNIFNDSSQEDRSGTMTATTLRGFGMADDLDFGATPFFGEPAIFPGGISFGTIAFVDGQFQSDGQKSTVEVVNVMLGEGNDKLDISRHLNPDAPVTATNTFTFAGAVGGGTVTRPGFDWRAQGFLPGQTVTISGLPGSWQVSAITDDNPDDTFVNTVLHLTGAMLPTGASLRTITASDAPVTATGTVTLAPTATGGTVTRAGFDFKAAGFVVGQLVMISGLEPKTWRLVGISGVGNSVLELRGETLASGTSTRTVYVPGQHGGLTVVHGGGNFALELNDEDQPRRQSHRPPRRTLLGRRRLQDRPAHHDRRAARHMGHRGIRRCAVLRARPVPTGCARRQPHAAHGSPISRSTTSLERSPSPNALKTTASGLMSIATSAITRSQRLVGRLTASMSARRCLSPDWPDRSRARDLSGNVMTLQSVALTPKANVQLTVFGYDATLSGGTRMGGDTINVSGGAGPDSPLVVYGDTSQDGAWYSGHSYDVLGAEFGDKPFDPFTNLPDADNEDDEWVFPLADPFTWHGNDVIDASCSLRRNSRRRAPHRRLHGLRRPRQRPDHRQPGRRPPCRRLRR